MKLALVAVALVAASAAIPGAARAGGVSLEIPPVLESAATLDGACSTSEYRNPAIGPAVATMSGVRSRDVYLMRDFQYLWICFSATPASWQGGVAVFVDPQADGARLKDAGDLIEDNTDPIAVTGEVGDFAVVVPFPAEEAAKLGADPWAAYWSNGWTGADPGGWEAASAFTSKGSMWSAEIRIAAAALAPGWKATIGLGLAWGGDPAGGTAIATWPARDAWAEATLPDKRLLVFPEMDFGYVSQGAQSKQALYLHNLSTTWSLLQPVTWSITGPDASAFQFDPWWLQAWIGVLFDYWCCPWPVSEVVFTPNRVGPHVATLTLWTPVDNSPHTIRLRGWGDCAPYCP
jgi:hypothetical protein